VKLTVFITIVALHSEMALCRKPLLLHVRDVSVTSDTRRSSSSSSSNKTSRFSNLSMSSFSRGEGGGALIASVELREILVPPRKELGVEEDEDDEGWSSVCGGRRRRNPGLFSSP
jgi:hypothetical protein